MPTKSKDDPNGDIKDVVRGLQPPVTALVRALNPCEFGSPHWYNTHLGGDREKTKTNKFAFIGLNMQIVSA